MVAACSSNNGAETSTDSYISCYHIKDAKMARVYKEAGEPSLEQTARHRASWKNWL